MAKIKADQKTIAIVVGVLAVIVSIVVVLKRRAKKAAPVEPPAQEPGETPSPPYVPSPPEIVESPPSKPDPPVPPVKPSPPDPDPNKPSMEPVQGQYYPVRKGDTMNKVLKSAGFPSGRLYKAYKTMLNHTRNAWIGTTMDFSGTDDEDELKEGTEILRFWRRFEPMSGKENLTWAWNTKCKAKTQPETKWPLVYVPGDGEVPA